ncbi:metallophosphoesterase [Enterococcus gallinarum]|uniref:metallophosphoesterase n=1 Tax=Enterococcus gallinarum TaxID=1353 RepID=UPI00391A1E24
MRIAHISDVHYHPSQKNFDLEILCPLIKDLEKQNQEKPIDLICYTGDLIDKGGFDTLNPMVISECFQEFEKNFVTPILESLNLDKAHFLFVPGNHDIDRKKINPIFENGLVMALNSEDSIQNYMRNPSQLHLDRIEAYKNFERSFFADNIGYKGNEFGYGYSVETSDGSIGVAGINSSWRCNDDTDEGKLIVGLQQLDSIKQSLNSDNKAYDLKIALMHHSFDFLLDAEKRSIQNEIMMDYDLLLIGHDHSTNAQQSNNSYGTSLVVSQAPSNWTVNMRSQSLAHHNGYTIIDYNKLEATLTLSFRRYNRNNRMFVPDTMKGMDGTGSTIFTFDRSLNEEWKRIKESIIDNLLDFTTEIQKVMVSFGTDSDSPKEIDDIFVAPRLEIRNHDKINNDIRNSTKKENWTIKDLVESEENYILFGPKEIGKTTILYKIYKYIFNQLDEKRVIPVFLDMDNNKVNFNKEIATFLALSNSKTTNLINNYKLVLLIDNIKIDGSEQSKTSLEHISNFIKEHPNIRVIGTTTSYGDFESSGKMYQNESLSSFTKINIEYFGTREIRDLMSKWLVNDKSSKKEISDLVRNFHSLNIPSTPLSVSLYLWIYEKQSDFRPVNNANLVRNFIEKSFEKHSMNEIYLSEFDYTNKESLLACIAFNMLNQKDRNYRISKQKVISVIKNEIQRKKMTVAQVDSDLEFSEWILKHYEDKGILISEMDNNTHYYRFKLKCFFDYFLAVYMRIDPEFKMRVFSPEYLIYEDEIEYYAGLNRHERFVLDFVYGEMIETFRNLINGKDKGIFEQIILESKIDFASYFNKYKANRSLVDLINLTDVGEQELDDILKKNKITDEKKDLQNDGLLNEPNNTYDRGEIETKNKIDEIPPIERLQKSWMICARVLKNLDELSDGEFKLKAFKATVYCSILTLLLLHKQSEIIIDNDDENEEIIELANFFVRFGLLLHESIFNTVMGTNKINGLVDEYISSFINNDPKNNIMIVDPIEQLFTILFYADNKGVNSLSYLNYAIKNLDGTFYTDILFLKLNILHSETESSTKLESSYKDLISQLMKKRSKGNHVVIQSKQVSKQQKINEEMDRKKRLIEMKNKK